MADRIRQTFPASPDQTSPDPRPADRAAAPVDPVAHALDAVERLAREQAATRRMMEAALERIDGLAAQDRQRAATGSAQTAAATHALAQVTAALSKLEARIGRIERAVERKPDLQAEPDLEPAIRRALDIWSAEHPEHPAEAAGIRQEIADLRDVIASAAAPAVSEETASAPAPDEAVGALATTLEAATDRLREDIAAVHAAVHALSLRVPLRDSETPILGPELLIAIEDGLERVARDVSRDVSREVSRELASEVARVAAAATDMSDAPDTPDALASEAAMASVGLAASLDRFGALLDRDEAAVDAMSDLAEQLTRLALQATEDSAGRLCDGAERLDDARRRLAAMVEQAVAGQDAARASSRDASPVAPVRPATGETAEAAAGAARPAATLPGLGWADIEADGVLKDVLGGVFSETGADSADLTEPERLEAAAQAGAAIGWRSPWSALTPQRWWEDDTLDGAFGADRRPG